MEHTIEHEFECQICMDILVEPVTTVCGHTYCKICLIRYLKTKLNCPMCRKPIFHNKESLSKNVLLENLIKNKHPEQYENKLKLARLSYDSENIAGDTKRYNIPTIVINNCYVWPNVKKVGHILDPVYEYTLTLASQNDRLILIMPRADSRDIIASLCEITNINLDPNKIDIEVLGLKRFKVNHTANVSELNTAPIYVSSGEVIKDEEIESQETLLEIKSKLNIIEDYYERITQHAPYSIIQLIHKLYGTPPRVMNTTRASVSSLEPISFYYMNLIKNEEKERFYLTTNLVERVEWIYDQFNGVVKHIGNPSLAFQFFDLKIIPSHKDQLKYTIFFFIALIILVVSLKFKIISTK